MKIIIINTHCANLFSVKIMINRLGYTPTISDEPEIISKADKLFLPGVGTASSVMKQLKRKKIIQLIQKCTQPILGICLGMQLFGSISEENNTQTLNIINIPIKHLKLNTLPVPHMGWNNIIPLKKHFLFQEIKHNDYFYFAHSYAMDLSDFTIAQVNYEQPFSAVIEYKNYYGVQFHPEKSSTPGRQLIKNFLER